MAKKNAAPKGKAGPRGPAGKNGTNGTNGAPGATGPAGPAGPAGGTGPAGNNGSNGTNGANGESVTTSKVGKGTPECPEGGTKFTIQGKSEHVCNGEKGILHPGETLAAEASEHGMFAVNGPVGPVSVGGEGLTAPISFTIPLRETLPPPNIHTIAPGETATMGSGCTGSVSAGGTITEPVAEPGNLCLFFREKTNVSQVGIYSPEVNNFEAGPSGAVLEAITAESTKPAAIMGVWVVTAK